MRNKILYALICAISVFPSITEAAPHYKCLDLPSYRAGATEIADIATRYKTNCVRLVFAYDNAESGGLEGYQSWWDNAKTELAVIVGYLSNNNLKAIINFQDPPLGNDTTVSPVENKIFQAGNQAAKDLFKSIWIEIATTYNSNPTILGYQFMNEPRTTKSGNWPGYLSELVAAVRAADSTPVPSQPIGFITTRYGNVGFASELQVPSDGGEYIISASFYAPHSYTHQGISDDKKIEWPGCKEIGTYGVSGKSGKKKCDKKKVIYGPLKNFVKKVKKKGVEAMITEFGVAAYAPGAKIYLQDVTKYLDKLGLHSNALAYRGAPVFSLDHEGSDIDNLSLASGNTDRAVVVQTYMQNGK